MGNNSFLHNASSYFDKMMKQTYVSKSEILSLKKKLKVVKDSGTITYNNILNRVTAVSRKANGKNSPEILRKIYDEFKEMTKTKLRELGANPSHEKATPGNFRACVMIDSCTYQIGDDTPDLMVAFGYCEEYSADQQPVQIFDDRGECHIIEGKLKK